MTSSFIGTIDKTLTKGLTIEYYFPFYTVQKGKKYIMRTPPSTGTAAIIPIIAKFVIPHTVNNKIIPHIVHNEPIVL